MKKLVLISSVCLLTACATPTPMPSGLSREERASFATKECKRVIQTKNLSNFDAYFSNGQFNYIGTERERFDFRKCVTDYGVEFENRPSDLIIENRR
jgi:hypothetical protein